MLERLKEYRRKFEQEKIALENADDEELVAEAVKKFEQEYRAKLIESRQTAIADKENEIQVIDKLILLETANAVMANVANENSGEESDDSFQSEETDAPVSEETNDNI